MRTYYIEKLAKLMGEQKMDAVMICPSEELRFLTGFSPMMCERFQALFIKASGEMFYICNLLYQEEMRKSFDAAIPVYSWFDGDVMSEVVSEILKEQGLGEAVIGVNSTAPAFQTIELASVLPIRFVNAKPLLEEMRICKTQEEMDALRHSAWIADQAFSAVLPKIHAGMKEYDVWQILREEMSSRGGEDAEGIVASGPNSSYPHYASYDRVIEEQDIIVLDFGCTWKGMYSDMSRTVFVGEPTAEQRKVYEIVDRSQLAAEKAAVLGAFIPEIDAAARDIIAEEGYDGTLLNRVGHGIGYMVHEAPDIKKSNPRHLEKGMAFSIEPGIYLAGRFGMRIENIVMINEEGETEILNKSSRELIVL